MKFRKMLMITAMLFLVLIIAIQTIGYAAVATPSRWYGISKIRTRTEEGLGYSIGDYNAGGSPLWNFQRYENSGSNSPMSPQLALYCLYAGFGFEEGTNDKDEYQNYYDMLTQRNDIKQLGTGKDATVYSNLVEHNNGTTYNQILALLDAMYIPGKSDVSYKKTLIDAAAEYAEDDYYFEYEYELSDDDIEAVQQAALWYYTNFKIYGTSKYNKTEDSAWLWVTAESGELAGTYKQLTDYKKVGGNSRAGEGFQRNEMAKDLYKYLIHIAEENANNYADGKLPGQPVVIKGNSPLNTELEGNNWIIGPITAEKNSSLASTLSLTISDGKNNNINYTILNERKENSSLDNMKNGGTFYISIPKSANVGTDLNIKFNVQYQSTTMTLWTSETSDEEQPLVEIDKGPQNVPTELTAKLPKDFDLALRKYITHLNDVPVEDIEGEEKREPSINKENLDNGTGTTATYTHKKEPLKVKVGDIITYNLTVYNEGSVKGRATKITDQLPEGLEFESLVSTGYTHEYNPTTKLLVLTKTGTNNLNEYVPGGTLYSETVTIKCRVTDAITSGDSKTLTNVAWISEAVNEETGETVDRDSQPDTKPNVNKDNMEDYNDHQQDDDDYEKLVVEKPAEEIFDLALRKYITEINGSTNISEGPRNPSITNTNVLNGSDASNHTATYNHRKDPVKVKEGDIITYNITVYNEGKTAGRATKITDQLPTGLVLVDYSTGEPYTEEAKGKYAEGPYKLRSYDTQTNKIVFEEIEVGIEGVDTNGDIPAYSGSGNPQSTTMKIKCKVTATASEDKDQVLTNVAWISEDSQPEDSKPDIDSQPSTAPQVSADGLVNEDENNYKGNIDNPNVSGENEYWKGQQDDDDFEKVEIEKPKEDKEFDLSLRKYISKINDTDVSGRTPQVNTSPLNGSGTTANYEHDKTPIEVKTGDLITYNLIVYNEGDYAGRATKLVDQLPTGIQFKELITQGYNHEYDPDSNILRLSKVETNNLNPYTGGETLDSEVITMICEVVATPNQTGNKVLTNVAWISEEVNSETNETITSERGKDRDSEPSTTPSVNKDNMEQYETHQQDDDDFERVVIKPIEPAPEDFDLKLIKKIARVNDSDIEDRLKGVDVSRLNITNGDTTANYDINKDPVYVKPGDLITYTFMVFNEGYVDGYASKITEDIPEGLEFIWSDKTDAELDADDSFTSAEKAAIKFNQERLWTYDTNMSTISTTYLSKENETTPGSNLIKAFGENDGTKTSADLKYKEVQVIFRVKSGASSNIVRNEAAITESTDSDGKPKEDRDSKTDEWKKYEDDEDYDSVILESFDLALRKFIVAVTTEPYGTSIDDETLASYLMKENGVYTRAPQVDTSKLNTLGEDGNLITTAEYNQSKDPVTVTVGSYVYYMIRVYNEGDIDGYAAEIKDHLPDGLEFVEGEFNDYYGWELEEDKTTVKTKYLADQLIAKAEKSDNGYQLTYKDVPILCRVSNSVKNNYKLTNIADITEYQDENKNPTEDRDSSKDNVNVPDEDDKPSYKDDEKGSYIPGQEDDDDFDKVIVQIFDLSLRKWVSEVIVIEDGVTYQQPTGHTPEDDPEQTVKVDLNRKKVDNTTVKFKFGIRVRNDGGIPGYATEITDYIPEGLEMNEAENPNWTYLGNNVAVTDQLKDTLLQPGEYADIEILLTWVNGDGNLGLKTNTAEITDDYNEYGVPDVDSIPGNRQPGEDDIDDAPVILSIVTGRVQLYIGLGMVVLVMLGGGIFLIKKYVI